MPSPKQKIAIALSGGVDSALAAKILCNDGYEVVGFFLKLWSDPTCKVIGENRCCDYEAMEDARSVATALGIKFYVIDARAEFKKEVVDNFIDEYNNLHTPNPCIICNEKIKFNLLLKRAMEIDCRALATGHYARISQDEEGNYHLFAGVDGTKDQSYMLYRLAQEQLSHVLFPLGTMTKKEVRARAVGWNLPVKEKAESQEICFFGDSDYREFLRRYLPESSFKSGDIIDPAGNLIGRHEGLVNYTIGQRRGVTQDTRNKIQETKKMYAIGFDIEKNQLIVGEDSETFLKEMTVSDIHWINPNFCPPELDSGSIKVKIRSQAKAVGCNIKYKKENIQNIDVIFNEPQRAVTPGQSAVFYVGDEVIGGGVISGRKDADNNIIN